MFLYQFIIVDSNKLYINKKELKLYIIFINTIKKTSCKYYFFLMQPIEN